MNPLALTKTESIAHKKQRRHLQFSDVVLVVVGLFVALLLVAQIVRSGWCNDESAHIPAGLYHLETGYMDAYRVNPPLPRMIGALPLLIDHPKIEWFSFENPKRRNEYTFAENWIRDNLESIPRQLILARSMILLYFALGAYTISRWAFELYGRQASWLALALWSLSPDVITYSATVAPDLPAAATGLFAGFCFWKWLVGGTKQVPWTVCFGVAIAVLSKFSWLFLFPLFVVLTIIVELRRDDMSSSLWPTEPSSERWTIMSRGKRAMIRTIKLVIAMLGAIVLINLVYGFDGTGRRLGEFEFLSRSLGDQSSEFSTGNRFRGTWLGVLPVPLPGEMLQGMDYVNWEFEKGMPCYLLGEWKFRGWWYYYLVAVALKLPIGYMVLMLIGGIAIIVDYFRCRLRPGEWIVPLVAVLFFIQISSQTGFTHHLRYVLPSLGYLFIVAARSILVIPQKIQGLAVVSCLSGIVVFHATHVGQAHTHFHWLAGGPTDGWRHLSLSNVDWGQSTYRMAQWARENVDKRPLTVMFVSERGNPALLVQDLDVRTSIEWKEFDKNEKHTIPVSGWYILSTNQLCKNPISIFEK